MREKENHGPGLKVFSLGYALVYVSGCVAGVPCQLRGENASFPFLIPVILFKLYRPSQVLSG
jgi:hypothetical protein